MHDSTFIKKAIKAKESAHAPYSNFSVGAILVTEKEKLFSGCNIESSSYSLTVCAERVAIFKAVSEGEKDFRQIFIATDLERYCPPCGACRQVLWDLAGNIKVTMINRDGNHISKMLSNLFPDAFDKHFLEDK